jgi:tetratricopeptide (TPR) repeat protein
MQRETVELNDFLVTLNEEADVSAAATRTLLRSPVTSWRELLNKQPSWCCYGTLDALLQHGHSSLDSDPQHSLAVASFVLSCCNQIPIAAGAEILLPLLKGTALKEQANANYVLQDFASADTAIRSALKVFETGAAFVIDYATALLAFAQISHERGDTVGALRALQDASGIFAEHAQPRRYLMTLEICGQILMDQREYAIVRRVYETAHSIAEHINDSQALARLNQARGACALYLGELDEATHYLTRAFLGFEHEKMHTAAQRAIWGIARVARERNELADALQTLHGVYAEFLNRGMLVVAAAVLIELGDVVTDMTGDVFYAREMSRQLAETMGAFDVPRNVRAAIDYLHCTTERSPSVTAARAALGHVREFLARLLGGESMIFDVPV